MTCRFARSSHQGIVYVKKGAKIKLPRILQCVNNNKIITAARSKRVMRTSFLYHRNTDAHRGQAGTTLLSVYADPSSFIAWRATHWTPPHPHRRTPAIGESHAGPRLSPVVFMSAWQMGLTCLPESTAYPYESQDVTGQPISHRVLCG